MPQDAIKSQWIDFIHQLQKDICDAIEHMDGGAVFNEDAWQRAEGKGGGGLTKVIQNGKVFEKGGVNTSVVYGDVTDAMRSQLNISRGGDKGKESTKWFAAGISLVIHPLNPFVPTVHCNYRTFELYDSEDVLTDRWFGGGTDLTPYYLFEEDARHFHQAYKTVCDEFDLSLYPTFKKQCDDYFVNKHRNNERRGIGGIFYDHERAAPAPSNSPNGGELSPQPSLREGTNSRAGSSFGEDGGLVASPVGGSRKGAGAAFWMNFANGCGNTFIPAYLPIVEKRMGIPFSQHNRHWQEIRRGRYVEFNLIHDRGTLFGLRTGGRIESILMSLPPTVRFEYNDQPEKDSEEEKLTQVLMSPRDWV
jgi:coproporphyrinogen III oxidase